MKFDIEIIITAVIVSMIGLFYICIFPQKTNHLKYGRLLLVGILICIVTSAGNSLVEVHWDWDYLIKFLSLRKIGRWFFRISASIGYIVMLWGIAGIIVTKIRTHMNSSS